MINGNTLESFIAEIPISTLIREISTESELTVQQAQQMVATYVNEMRVAIDLVAPLLAPGQRILEIGAGLCLFSLFLKQLGYNVTALEPAMGGFDAFALSKRLVLKQYHHLNLPTIEITAQSLTPELYGKFDLIFSCNVLEHIPDYGAALQALTNCLSNNGVMVHGCPNYLIPYEPHFQIPVVKIWPRLSYIAFRHHINQRQSLWTSLNFISYFDVCKVAKSCNLGVQFRRGLMYQSVMRLHTDLEFSQRQASGFMKVVQQVSKFYGIQWLLKHLPPYLATPMIFELRLLEQS